MQGFLYNFRRPGVRGRAATGRKKPENRGAKRG